jgi:hypothetical protein
MAEEALLGDELKRMVKIATTRELAFAFNPGKGEDEPFFTMHRTKSPEILGRVAKSEGGGPKSAFGTGMVASKVMSLTCEAVLPGLAKKLKKFLNSQNVKLNVRILGPDGTVLEEDIEDLPDDPEDVTPPVETGLGSEEGVTPDTPQPDRGPLVERTRTLGARIAGAPEPVAEKLQTALRAAIEQIKAGALVDAGGRLDQIEAVLGRLPPVTGDVAPQTSPDPDQPDPAALVQRVKAVQGQLPGLPEPSSGNIGKAVVVVLDMLRARDLQRADAALTRIETVLRDLAERGQPGQGTGEGDPSGNETSADPRTERLRVSAQDLRRRVEALPGGDAAAALLRRMDRAETAITEGEVETAVAQLRIVQEALRQLAGIERLTPRVTQALSAGTVADPNALRLTFDLAIERAAGDDPGQVAGLLQQVEALLREGVESGTSRNDEVSEDVQPFAMARLEWAAALQMLRSEMTRLQAAIREACGEDPELADAADAIEDLEDYVAALDAPLEDALDAIVNADAGPRREALKGDARKVVADLLKELEAPFFQDVDDNGFVPVAVAATARGALTGIDRVLAG